MKTANIIIAIILIIFGCYYAYLTTGLPDRNLPNTLGGSFMPWVLVTCFLGLSILMLLDTLIKGTAEKCDYRIPNLDKFLVDFALEFRFVDSNND